MESSHLMNSFWFSLDEGEQSTMMSKFDMFAPGRVAWSLAGWLAFVNIGWRAGPVLVSDGGKPNRKHL
jgi:hypothetical protein